VKLGKKIHNPHFSLGWCKTRRDFYNFAAENIKKYHGKIYFKNYQETFILNIKDILF